MMDVLAIVGPTASGKSAAALAIAEKWSAEIVSCDSMQIYRGLDIGTAKPSTSERARVPHHLLDVIEPSEGFSAARYAELAERAIADCSARGKRVLVVGGTGLYLRALRFGLVEAPSRDEALRTRLYDEEHRRPGTLHLRLRAVDPRSAARIESADLVRVVRALEVFELTGRPLSEHHSAQDKKPRVPMRVAFLDPAPAQLDLRIAVRAERMIQDGLLDEVMALRTRFGAGTPCLSAVGYKEAAACLDGLLARAQLAPAIAQATRRYARRQRTWFKKEPDAERYDSAESLVARETRV